MEPNLYYSLYLRARDEAQQFKKSFRGTVADQKVSEEWQRLAKIIADLSIKLYTHHWNTVGVNRTQWLVASTGPYQRNKR